MVSLLLNVLIIPELCLFEQLSTNDGDVRVFDVDTDALYWCSRPANHPLLYKRRAA